MPINTISKQEEVGVLDLIDDVRSLSRDTLEFFNKEEVQEFLLNVATTVLSISLAVLLWKVLVRSLLL